MQFLCNYRCVCVTYALDVNFIINNFIIFFDIKYLFDVTRASPNIYEWDDESRIDSPRNNMELLIEDFVSIISTLIIILFLSGVSYQNNRENNIILHEYYYYIVIRIFQRNLFWVLTRLNVFRVISGSNQNLNLPQL